MIFYQGVIVQEKIVLCWKRVPENCFVRLVFVLTQKYQVDWNFQFLLKIGLADEYLVSRFALFIDESHV